MTGQEEKVQRYDKRQRGIELKKRLATLGSKLADYSKQWRTLGDTFRDYEYNSFLLKGETIEVERVMPSESDRPGRVPSTKIIASVSLSYCNSVDLLQLLVDLDETKRELAEIKTYCISIGDPL